MFESKAKIAAWAECGDDFFYGKNGEKKDYESAVFFYEKAARKKHPHATYMLGLCYELGRFVKKDFARAQALFQAAAALGDEDAGARLEEDASESYDDSAFLQDTRVEHQPEPPAKPQAPDLRDRDTGELPAITPQAVAEDAYAKALALVKAHSIPDAVPLLKTAANAGHVVSARTLGNFFRDGRGVMRDYHTAEHWYRRGMELGDAACARLLEEMKAGWNEETRRIEAEADARKQTAQKSNKANPGQAKPVREKKNTLNPLAQGLELLANNKYVRDVDCLQELAEQGDIAAMAKLGLFLTSGEAMSSMEFARKYVHTGGTFAEGTRWLKKAAALGSAEAKQALQRRAEGDAAAQAWHEAHQNALRKQYRAAAGKDERSQELAHRRNEAAAEAARREEHRRKEDERLENERRKKREASSAARIASLNKNTYGKK